MPNKELVTICLMETFLTSRSHPFPSVRSQRSVSQMSPAKNTSVLLAVRKDSDCNPLNCCGLQQRQVATIAGIALTNRWSSAQFCCSSQRVVVSSSHNQRTSQRVVISSSHKNSRLRLHHAISRQSTGKVSGRKRGTSPRIQNKDRRVTTSS